MSTSQPAAHPVSQAFPQITVPTTPAEAAQLVLDLVPELGHHALAQLSTTSSLATVLRTDMRVAGHIVRLALAEATPDSALVGIHVNQDGHAEAVSVDDQGPQWWPLTNLGVTEDVAEFLAVATDGVLTARHNPAVYCPRNITWVISRTALDAATAVITEAAHTHRAGGIPATRGHGYIAGTETEAAAVIIGMLPGLLTRAELVDHAVKTVAANLGVSTVDATTMVNRAAGDPRQGELLRFRVTERHTARPVSHAEQGHAHALVAMTEAGYPAATDERLTITAGGRLRPAPNGASVPGTDWLVSRTALDAAVTAAGLPLGDTRMP